MATSVTLKPNAIDISGSTSGTTTLQASAVAGTTTLTLPAATDTLVGKATTDTLTNKTLTGAAMNGTLGATTPSTASVTTLTTSSTVTHSGGTANGVAYLDGSKVLTTGSALVFDGTNLGVGTSSPANKLDVSGTVRSTTQTAPSSGAGMELFYDSSGNVGYLLSYNRSTSAYKQINFGASLYNFGIAGSTAMALDASGNLLVGTTSSTAYQTGNNFVFNTGSAGAYEIVNHTTSASGSVYIGFGYNGSGIGSITQNGTTGVLYNLTSDYRLKNDQQVLTGAKDFIMALKPKKWQWWDGSGEGVGFVAHEFMEVAKYSGNGEKDAVDADGNPVYQSIQPSSSEVMANLVAFIQEQQAIITQLQADVAALKGA